MQRVKTKKKKDPTPKFPTHFVMGVIMPCVMLAIKDEFNAKPDKLDRVAKRIQRYIDHIADGQVPQSKLREMMECKDISGKPNYAHSTEVLATVVKTEEANGGIKVTAKLKDAEKTNAIMK